MKEYKEKDNVIDEILHEIKWFEDRGMKEPDLSDVGNNIGRAVARYFDDYKRDDDHIFGTTPLSDFCSGLEHGISLTDGSHDGDIDRMVNVDGYYDEHPYYSQFIKIRIPNWILWIKSKIKK